jgi:hypothetical protein
LTLLHSVHITQSTFPVLPACQGRYRQVMRWLLLFTSLHSVH